jgi:molecular chaperone IbpA
MRTIDFSPAFRSTIGFDRMARLVNAANHASGTAAQPNYPPYNIAKVGDDAYRITMAVAGFSEADIDITVKERSLTVSGKVEKEEEGQTATFLHRGIAARAFERRFDLADYIIVNSAEIENGLLHIDLVREVPEEKKPRRITISSRAPKLEKKAA